MWETSKDDGKLLICPYLDSFSSHAIVTTVPQGRSQTSEQDEANLGHRRCEPLGGSEGKPPPPQEKFQI